MSTDQEYRAELLGYVAKLLDARLGSPNTGALADAVTAIPKARRDEVLTALATMYGDSLITMDESTGEPNRERLRTRVVSHLLDEANCGGVS